MGEFIISAARRFADFFNSLSPGRRIAFVSLTIAILISLTYIFGWASKASFQPLTTANTTAEDAVQIVRFLRDRKVPFKVDDSGKIISVPRENLYDLRLELASAGHAQAGIVGYEVFDQQKFGTTSTVQKINLVRAREGELVRTINNIRGVSRSRVHLAIPEESAFIQEKKSPTASVILDVQPGKNLEEKQIEGIQNLVASAVAGLEKDFVTVVASDGKQLSKNSRDPMAAFVAASLDYQRTYENKIESKIETLLNRVVGQGKVIAKVSANFDFSQISETETLLDADNVTPVSVDRDKDTMRATRPSPQGNPGVQSNVPGADGTLAANNVIPPVSNDTTRSRETLNYEIPKTRRNIRRPFAELQSISVAVMIDGNYVAGTDEAGTPQYQPWPQEKIEEFKSLVSNVVGKTANKPVEIEVKNMQFFQEDIESATLEANRRDRNRMIRDVIMWLVLGLVFILFFMVVVRPFIKWVTENTVDSVEDFLPQTLEELEKAQGKQTLAGMEEVLPELEERVDPEKIQSEMMKEKILTLVNDNPHKAAQILHEWIHARPASNEEGEGNEAAI